MHDGETLRFQKFHNAEDWFSAHWRDRRDRSVSFRQSHPHVSPFDRFIDLRTHHHHLCRETVNPNTVSRSPPHPSNPFQLTRFSQPWGHPSSPINICSLQSGTKVAFLARHGKNHDISPSTIPSRANIAALKSLGVRAIIAFSSVGSLREEIVPGHIAIPTQIIDRTKGTRPGSFFDGTRVVAHAAFGDPFGTKLVRWLEVEVEKALREQGNGVVLHKDKCIICMEGPQFSTRAESMMYRSWGADLINMSVLPEAKLAREAEIR